MKRFSPVLSLSVGVAAGVSALGSLSETAWGQADATSTALTTPADATKSAPATDTANHGQLLDDFLFYVLTAKPELALSNGRALLDSGITNAELVELIDSRDTTKRVEDSLRRGRNIEGIESLMAEFETRVETGRQDLARNPKRIEEAISMLVGPLRGQLQARGRLETAGDYAVPALLRVIVETRGADLELAATEMIKRIRRQAITPLGEALMALDPISQRKVCDMLGEMGWPHAAPYLAEVAAAEKTPLAVKDAAMRAFRQVSGGDPDTATQFAALSDRYFHEETTLIAWPEESVNNVWSYDPVIGLESTPVPTEVFSEVMAMRTARRALTAAPGNAQALGLYVGANLKRENELPAGKADPIFGESKYTPQFFATAAGTATCQHVLALAIDTKNTALVRDAIAALSQTTGGAI